MIKVQLVTYRFINLIKVNLMFESNVNLWKCKQQILLAPIKSYEMSKSSYYDPTKGVSLNYLWSMLLTQMSKSHQGN